VGDLTKNFADIAPPLTPDFALLEANKCLFCHDAPCTIACPTHIDVPAFIKKIATGNLRGSARVILEANPFGHSCARACPVEVLCEGACVLNARDEQPIKIALLQRHATDYVLERKVKLFEAGKPTGKKVAIVGAGPAGLACARDLRRWGHAVTVFEAKSQPGGLNTYGIAEYKLKADVALAEAQDILDLGVELKLGMLVKSLGPLLEEYDAVFVGVGLGKTKSLGIPGEALEGVVDALSFIEHLKTHPYQGREARRRHRRRQHRDRRGHPGEATRCGAVDHRVSPRRRGHALLRLRVRAGEARRLHVPVPCRAHAHRRERPGGRVGSRATR